MIEPRLDAGDPPSEDQTIKTEEIENQANQNGPEKMDIDMPNTSNALHDSSVKAEERGNVNENAPNVKEKWRWRILSFTLLPGISCRLLTLESTR